ncbi:hypothetical protein LJY25_10385 [Hymenobacter sp. BT175]|uniref:hypothetical protein n=1 Tax=Hymenobacter translucens TaxID=2886507 RepID=UPI001D0EC81B|nr:hypothetical protein [Hymenobacter translucens]MCC2546852.1 hypothetical protein [Hymenobacter translucens]
MVLVLSCPLSTLTHAQTTVPAAASVAPASRVAPVSTPAPVAAPNAAVPSSATWALVQTIKLTQPGSASLDRRGNLYVTDRDDNIHQYGPDGQALNTFSPPLPGHTAQLEAWNTTKILAFYDDRQEILLLDRFMSPIGQFRTAEFIDGMVRAATLAPDDRIWLLNESDLTLRLFDPTQQRLVRSTSLDLLIGRTRPDFRFLRQYQNNLYLLDRQSGVYVFDNLGTYRKKLPFLNLSAIGFRGDELYFLADGALHFFHLYNLTERTMPLPVVVGDVRQILIGEGYVYALNPDGVQVFRW